MNINPQDLTTRYPEAAIEADPAVPMVHIVRDFNATPSQLMRAHTEAELFARWVGPSSLTTTIDQWDCRTLGSYRYVSRRGEEEHAFRGTFPSVTENRIVQTFAWEGMPDEIALETLTFIDLGDGRTRLHAQSLCDSFEARDGMLRSGMDTGIHEGYAKLDDLLGQISADDTPPTTPAERHRSFATRFGAVVDGVEDWDAPTPVREWRARDVVRHLVEWFPGFLAMGSHHRLPEVTSVDEDPSAAWSQHSAAVQALLDDAETATSIFRSQMFPDQPLEDVIDRFYSADVFMHTWDLAVATSQDARLSPAFCGELLDGMVPMEQVIRQSGQYGDAVEVPADADVQTRLLGFIGRDPGWRP